MAVLLLRLAAPLQAWGADSKFETRRTNREPTKSGVIGMLAAALGLRRDQTEELRTLSKLRFAVRIDREGQLLVDFHIAKNPEKRNADFLIYRHYLQDAVFLAGIESEDTEMLEHLESALSHPAFPLYLGRRSCPITLPLSLGIRSGELTEVLEKEPVLCERNERQTIRIIADAEPGEYGSAVQKDVPLSFNPEHRQYGYRSAKEIIVRNEAGETNSTEHDPFTEL